MEDCDQLKEAKIQLLEAYDMCLHVKKPSAQSLGFANIALRLQEIEEEELYIEILNQALDSARTIQKEATRWRILQEVANKFSKIKEYQIAFMVADEIQDHDWRHWVLLEALGDCSHFGSTLYDKHLVFLKGLV